MAATLAWYLGEGQVICTRLEARLEQGEIALLQALSERLLVVVGAVHLRAVQFRFQFAAAEGGAAPDG